MLLGLGFFLGSRCLLLCFLPLLLVLFLAVVTGGWGLRRGLYRFLVDLFNQWLGRCFLSLTVHQATILDRH